MSRRPVMVAASFILLMPAAVSAAPGDTHVRADPGAIAGRSPHHGYRLIAAAPRPCGTTMHTIPAGKLPTYGTHALPRTDCATAIEVAAGGSATDHASR